MHALSFVRAITPVSSYRYLHRHGSHPLNSRRQTDGGFRRRIQLADGPPSPPCHHHRPAAAPSDTTSNGQGQSPACRHPASRGCAQDRCRHWRHRVSSSAYMIRACSIEALACLHLSDEQFLSCGCAQQWPINGTLLACSARCRIQGRALLEVLEHRCALILRAHSPRMIMKGSTHSLHGVVLKGMVARGHCT